MQVTVNLIIYQVIMSINNLCLRLIVVCATIAIGIYLTEIKAIADLILEGCDNMLAVTSSIKEEIEENQAQLELYRLIGEGYKAMQEKREITIEELEQKIEQRRMERG